MEKSDFVIRLLPQQVETLEQGPLLIRMVGDFAAEDVVTMEAAGTLKKMKGVIQKVEESGGSVKILTIVKSPTEGSASSHEVDAFENQVIGYLQQCGGKDARGNVAAHVAERGNQPVAEVSAAISRLIRDGRIVQDDEILRLVQK